MIGINNKKIETKINNFIDDNKDKLHNGLNTELSWYIAKLTGTRQSEGNMIWMRNIARSAILHRLY